VAAAFGAAHREFDPCPLIGSSAAGFKKSPAANELMIWPHELGGNGMFIVAWKRRAAEK
jgi:hypothetical protein